MLGHLWTGSYSSDSCFGEDNKVKNKYKIWHWHKPSLALGLILLGLAGLFACGGKGGGGSSGGGATPATRTFYLGTTPFFATATAFPDWRFENLDDKDLLSVHVDDFWGIPWDDFRTSANPSTIPAAWVTKWNTLANNSRATGKTLYLSLSPLGNRKTLAPRVLANGDPDANWAPVDSNGCYSFATDINAAAYKTAFIRYAAYVINLVQPKFASPAIEINIQFSSCSAVEKAAWIAWYTDVHNAIKSAYPTLIVFPTFQIGYMYGISATSAACIGGVSVTDCFTQRLTEALSIPGDRIAFSNYPIEWKFHPEFSFSYPTDTFAIVKNATSRKIWVAETGWASVRMRQSYPHGGSGVCGTDIYTTAMANDTEHANYLSWLLGEAQTRGFEAVIWWLNRDYLDAAVAEGCPCSGNNDTCALAETFHTAGGDFGEAALRMFGNMALRHYDGTPRVGQSTWHDYYNRSWSPTL